MVQESQTRRFCSCIKKVRKTLKSRKESGAIAICVTSVLQGKGRTLKKFHCKGPSSRVTTQPQKGGKSTKKYHVTLVNHKRGDTIKIVSDKGPTFILHPGDKVTHIEWLEDKQHKDEEDEIFTYVGATYHKNHTRVGPAYIVTKLKFRDDNGISDFVSHDRFQQLTDTIKRVKESESLYVSPVTSSSLSYSKSASRSSKSKSKSPKRP